MDDHRQLQEAIPALLANRLDEQQALELERHLDDCPECARLVGAGKILVSGFREGGPSLLEAHPDARTLTAFGTGEATDPDGSIGRHLETCMACRLEVDVWKEQGQAPGFGLTGLSGTGASRRVTGYRVAAAAAVAGILIGAGLTSLFSPSPTGPTWSGPVGLTVLERPMRSDSVLARLVVEPDQPYLALAVAPVLPTEATDSDLFRFEIRDADGETVWSHDLDAGRIRRALAGTGVASFLVPSESLPPANYTLRLRPRAGADEPLLEIPFEVVHESH